MGLCPRVFHVSFSCFPGSSLALEPRSRLGVGVLGPKVGRAGEQFEDNESGELMFVRVLVPAFLSCIGKRT